MNEKEMLESLVKSVTSIQADVQNIKSDMQEMKDRTQRIENDVQEVKDRTLKLEVTIENITNRNILRLVDGHQLNAEKINIMQEQIDDVETSLIAFEINTLLNKQEILELKRKAQ